MYIKINNETSYVVQSYSVGLNDVDQNTRRLILDVVNAGYKGDLVGQTVSIYIYDDNSPNYSIFRGKVLSITGKPNQRTLSLHIGEQT